MAHLQYEEGTVLVPTFSITDLAAGEVEVGSSVGGADNMPWCDIRVTVDPTAAPAVNDVLLDVYFIETVDGVEEDTDVNADAEGYFSPDAYVGSVVANDSADHTAKDYIIRAVRMPVGAFKPAVKNRDSTALGAAVTMDIQPWSLELSA